MKTVSVKNVIALFRLPTDNMELLRAQYAAFSKQIPLLYFILTTNSLAAAYTFSHFAPPWLAIYLPSALSAVCIMRCAWWWRMRHKAFSDAELIKYTRLTTRLAGFLTFAFIVWGITMYPYGDAYAQGQMVFCTALTVIGCVFCLMHLRPAALTVTLVANTPFILYLLIFESHPSLKAVAVNLALVSAAMIIILLVYSRDFAKLVASQAETRRLGEDNFRIANLDSLTGLANRRWFFAELDKVYHAAQAGGGRFAVGILDLDGFKPVNDTYGHMTGDRVLVEAAQRLQTACGDGVVLARLGGDEFGFIIREAIIKATWEETSLQCLGDAVREAIRLPYPIGTSHALLGCSIGVAVYPDSGRDPASLFERADYALYHAKRHLRGQLVLFSTMHEEQIRSHGVIEQALQNADFEQEMSLAFQPIVDIRTGRAVAFEALARWHSPTLGWVGPDLFIPVAERAGLIRNLTKVLLGKALTAAACWPEQLRIAFNLSTHDLCSAESVVQLIALINRSGVPPRRIDFEITETSVSHDFAQAHAAVRTFKALGVGISLDDFGTGFSSLSHVHRLPLDKLKVDRSFVTDINDNPASLKIVKSLTALSADMGLTCVIEGVETEAQLRTLRDLGCTMIQGYLIARPMPAHEVLPYLDLEDKLPSRRRMKL